MVTLKLTVIAVEATHDGVVIVLAQEKMRVPIAEPEMNSDEMRFAKKMSASFRMMGIQMNPMGGHDPLCPNNPSWKTGFWVTNEDYEAMDKPTVGDVIAFNMEKERPVATMPAPIPAPKKGKKVAKT